MIRKIKDYYCDYCGTQTDFGNICGSCKGKKRKGVKLEKKYKKGVKIGIASEDTCLEIDEKELRWWFEHGKSKETNEFRKAFENN